MNLVSAHSPGTARKSTAEVLTECEAIKQRLDQMTAVADALNIVPMRTVDSFRRRQEAQQTLQGALPDLLARLSSLQTELEAGDDFSQAKPAAHEPPSPQEQFEALRDSSYALMGERKTICDQHPDAKREVLDYNYCHAFLRLTARSQRRFGITEPPALSTHAARLDQISQQLKSVSAAVQELSASPNRRVSPVAVGDYSVPVLQVTAGHGKSRAMKQADDRFAWEFPQHALRASLAFPGSNSDLIPVSLDAKKPTGS